MKKLKLVIFAMVCTFTSSMTNALLIEVSQESSAGGGDFDSNILGQISTFDTSLSLSDFYSYSNPFNASFCDGVDSTNCSGRPILTDGSSHWFFVNAADGLGFFVVNDKPNNVAPGGNVSISLSLSGDTASVLVSDDAGEFTTSDGVNFSTPTAFSWIACCTDGAAIGTLENDWMLLGGFDAIRNGITGWSALSDGTSDISLALQTDRRVRFQVFDDNGGGPGPSPVPEPATLVLFGLGLAGLGWSRRKCA